jgi:uncharacterized protein YndB with AHSA1/START domain
MTATSNTRQDRHGSAVVTLPNDTDIVITRSFDAPATLLFKAYTTPELVKRWWGFDSSQWLVCEIDLRVGGQWRYVTREETPEGDFEVGFHGEYREIEAPTRLVSTEVFEGMPDAAALDTIVFSEAGGVTTMTMTVTHSCQEHRDAHIASGMEGGMQISMDRLEDVAAELAAA